MRFEFLFLGKTKEEYLAAGIADYVKRLARYTEVDVKILKEKKAYKKEPEIIQIEKEGEILLQNVQGDYLVCLDRGGRTVDSIGLADLVERWKMQGRKKISFLIGGDLGLSAAVLARADLVLSLSPMTFTHDMTRLILLEQLYRACTITAGEKYHK